MIFDGNEINQKLHSISFNARNDIFGMILKKDWKQGIEEKETNLTFQNSQSYQNHYKLELEKERIAERNKEEVNQIVRYLLQTEISIDNDRYIDIEINPEERFRSRKTPTEYLYFVDYNHIVNGKSSDKEKVEYLIKAKLIPDGRKAFVVNELQTVVMGWRSEMRTETRGMFLMSCFKTLIGALMSSQTNEKIRDMKILGRMFIGMIGLIQDCVDGNLLSFIDQFQSLFLN